VKTVQCNTNLNTNGTVARLNLTCLKLTVYCVKYVKKFKLFYYYSVTKFEPNKFQI